LLPAKYTHFVSEKSSGNPNTCTENTESDNTSNHHTDLHNPMSTHCQFTVNRSEERVDLTVAAAANTEISFGALCYGSE
jgi:hypothetical protein